MFPIQRRSLEVTIIRVAVQSQHVQSGHGSSFEYKEGGIRCICKCTSSRHEKYWAPALVTFQLSSCVDARARASQPTRARRLCAACLSLLRPFSRASKVSFVPSVPVNGHIFPLSPLREPDIIYRTLFVSGKRGPQRWRTPCLTAHNQPCFSQPPSLSHFPVNVFPSSSPNCEKPVKKKKA